MNNPFLNPDDYVIFDTETTGLRNPHPVEISIIDLTGKTLLNSRLKPPILIEPDATAIHGCSTPFGIRDSTLFLNPVHHTRHDVLNAFRHQRFDTK